ncbi:MAG: YbaB/EbfC family nucleoid-associated protein [Bacilli bacterium]|jgi:DNA-binding YbaB/EbfC family protein|nr:YbaB/EbfC family nucleoid-associated protein [Bacilli bacterium]
MNQMQQMMIQAQKMQRELQKAYDELDKKEFKVSKAGLVEIVVLGNRQIQKIDIEKDGLDPDNKEMIEDLIVSGLNELFEKIDEEKDAIEERITGRKGGFGF